MKNPPAFPQALQTVMTDEERHGMTLLDYFAGRALIGLFNDKCAEEVVIRENGEKLFAKQAYVVAQAMLEEREKHIK